MVFNLLKLKVLFKKNQLKLVPFKISNNIIDSPKLLECINFKINTIGSRDKSLFYLRNSTKITDLTIHAMS